MKRTLFNYHIKKDIQVESFHHIIDNFKMGETPEDVFSYKLIQQMEVFFSEDLQLQRILKIAQETHVLLHLISDNNAVLALPWQFYFDQYPLIGISKGNKPINKYVPPKKSSKLNVLMIFSSPFGQSSLDIKHESHTLLSRFLNNGVNLKIADDGSLVSLENILQKEHFDIIYYSGHGSYKNGETTLFFETPLVGHEDEISGQNFVDSIVKHAITLPQLVILSSCNTALGKVGFEGVTNLLLDNDISAVISFSNTIEQENATFFCSMLAYHLSRKYDLLDAYKFSVNLLKKLQQRPKNGRVSWLESQLFLQKHIEKLVGYEDKTTLKNNYPKCFFKSKIYLPFLHRNEIRELSNLILKGNAKINISGHRGLGKSACINYIMQNHEAFVPDLKILHFIGNKCTLSALKEKASILIGKPIIEIKNDLTTYAQEHRLLIVIDQIDDLVVVNNNSFVLSNEVLDLVKQIENINIFLITRFPIINDVFQIIKFPDISIPQLFFIFKKSFLGEYINKALPSRTLSSVFSNHPLYLIIKALFSTGSFGGILELYMIFEDLLSKNIKEIDVYDSEQSFLEDHTDTIRMALYLYEVHDKKEGYYILSYLKRFDKTLQKIIKTASIHKTSVGKKILIPKNLKDKETDIHLKKLVALNLIETDDIGRGEKLYRTHPLLSNSQFLEVEDFFDKKAVADYLLSFFDERHDSFKRTHNNTYINYLNEAFYLYANVNDKSGIVSAGKKLCHEYNINSSPDDVIRIGKTVFQIIQDQTPIEVLELLFQAYQRKGLQNDADYISTKYKQKAIDEKGVLDIINSYHLEGNAYTDKGLFKKASDKYDRALTELKKSVLKAEEASMLELAILSDSANALRHINKSEEAEKRLLKAYKIMIDLKVDSPEILDNLLAFYIENNKHNKSLYYAEKTLTESTLKHNQTIEINALKKQGVIYMQKHKFVYAKTIFNQVMHLAILASDSFSQAEANTYLGHVYLLEGEYMESKNMFNATFYKKALKFFFKAREFYTEEQLIDLYQLYNMMATCSSKIQQPKQAISYREQQLLLASQMEDLKIELPLYTALGIDYGKQGNVKKSMEYYELHNDKINKRLNQGNIDLNLKNTLLSRKMLCSLLIANTLYRNLKSEEAYYNYSTEAFSLFFIEKLQLPYSIERQFIINANAFINAGFQCEFQNELETIVKRLANKYLR